jgi:RimJ/RimL family protein N-acetyltransferase
MVELMTPRLRLRRWRDDDVAAMSVINADPEVVGNDASARVMLKLGMRFDRETTEVVYGRRMHVYAISREDLAA